MTRKGTILLTAAVTGLLAVVAWNFVGPEKEIERQIAHRYAVHDEAFMREMSVLLGPTIVGGNTVRALQNGDEIFPALLAAVHDARQTISFETYIYWSGEIGSALAEALAERARAGVAVHVHVDWVGSQRMEAKLLELMEAAGVEVHRYRPLHWYSLGRINNRTHRKLLVVDGRIAFTGGVGVADLWTGHAQDPQHWRDIHFRLEGPAAAQFQAAFNDNWIKSTGQVLNGEDYFPALEATGNVPAQLFMSSPAGGSESMQLMYLMTIAAARQSLDLQSAYFVPDSLALAALLEARQRNVRIRVIVPGEHTDSDAVRAASRASWGELLEAGVEIYEYQPTMMHNKLLVADQLLVSCGSTNFDPRSFSLNDEASLNLYDPKFADDMTRVFEADLEHTRRYTLKEWQERPLRERLHEWVVRPIRSQL
jgi:cardiolipin synthase A/B